MNLRAIVRSGAASLYLPCSVVWQSGAHRRLSGERAGRETRDLPHGGRESSARKQHEKASEGGGGPDQCCWCCRNIKPIIALNRHRSVIQSSCDAHRCPLAFAAVRLLIMEENTCCAKRCS